jgi:hypothetical protein
VTSTARQLGVDVAEVERTLRLLIEPGEIFELRALARLKRDGRKLILSGYFCDVAIAAQHVARSDSSRKDLIVTGWYATLNPVDPILRTRRADRIDVVGSGETTSDDQILRRTRLLLDFDAARVAGVSATDAEHDAALALANEAADELIRRGWPESLLSDSGNGGHVVPAIDLPANDGGLVERVLAAAQARWGRTIGGITIKVDGANKNPARITKLLGTPVRKGENTAERPHRQARILRAPERPEAVTRDQLVAFADNFAPTRQTKNGAKPKKSLSAAPLDLVAWLARHSLEVRKSSPWRDGGTIYVLATCPFDPDHNRGEAHVEQHASGAISAGCHHDSCTWGWRELRAKFDGASGAKCSPYVIHDGALSVWCKPKEGEPYPSALCNFVASIDEEIIVDDGAERVRYYAVSGTLADGTALEVARVPAAEYGDLAWIPSSWGARAIVGAGRSIRDQLRAAIQHLSTPAVRLIYRHTGWREIDGEWNYLHGGGAVGRDDVEVELDAPLDRYELPGRVDELCRAVTISASLLDCGPAMVMFPLLGAIYLAPISSIIPPDFTTALVGPSGNLKTELCGLAQAHFGRFTAKSLPENWSSTENHIEATLFAIKDSLVVVDDYKPQIDPRVEQRAHRVLTNVGNRASRGRNRADSTGMPSRPPRGLVLSSGEQLPGDAGDSTQARLVEISVDKEKLDLVKITELQREVERFPHAIRGYVEWLRPRYNELRSRLPNRHFQLRGELGTLLGHGGHLRVADSLARLLLGVEMFAAFAEAAGAAEKLPANWRAKATTAFLEIGKRKIIRASGGKPAIVFLRVVRAMIATGRAHIDPAELKDQERADLNARTYADGRAAKSELIGWCSRDRGRVYFEPDAAFRAVAEYLRESDRPWSVTKEALAESLVQDAGARRDKDHYAPKVTCAGRNARRWDLPINVLEEPADPSTQAEFDLAPTVPPQEGSR